MRTIVENVEILTNWNHSMAVALKKAGNGSNAEDMYFIEKLRNSAAVLGFSLTRYKEPKVCLTEYAV